MTQRVLRNPIVDRAITQSLRAANSAASGADQTCDPRAAKLHTVANTLHELLYVASPDQTATAAAPQSADLEKTP
jgi:hypothetical protein